MKILELKNVKIRLARESDCRGILNIYAPYVLSTEVSFETAVPSESEIKSRMETQGRRFPWIVCEADGKIAGYAYASPHRERASYAWSCDCSVYVDAAFHSKRIGTALYTCLFDILRLQGFYSVFAGVSLPNEKSCALHESMGFYPVGIYQNAGYKSGRWIDTKWYGLKLLEPVPFPDKPKPTCEICPEKLTGLFHKAERMIIL
jgi:phosphinothricin acetyltransferase